MTLEARKEVGYKYVPHPKCFTPSLISLFQMRKNSIFNYFLVYSLTTNNGPSYLQYGSISINRSFLRRKVFPCQQHSTTDFWKVIVNYIEKKASSTWSCQHQDCLSISLEVGPHVLLGLALGLWYNQQYEHGAYTQGLCKYIVVTLLLYYFVK